VEFGASTLRRMKKRTLAALLWFYAGWYAGAMIAFHAGLSEALGPILGTAAAGLIAGDPRRLIWGRKRSPTRAATPSAAAEPA
jgi:hypothetical protein